MNPEMLNDAMLKPRPRTCPRCFCEGASCSTTLGPCFWLAGEDLCGACLFPTIRLRDPRAAAARVERFEAPLTVRRLCSDAMVDDREAIRWFWAVYGRSVRDRISEMICLAATGPWALKTA
jgi:hypothetical protein